MCSVHAAAAAACSGLFIISPTGILRQITVNDLPVGRSVEETLRLVRAFQVSIMTGYIWLAKITICCTC